MSSDASDGVIWGRRATACIAAAVRRARRGPGQPVMRATPLRAAAPAAAALARQAPGRADVAERALRGLPHHKRAGQGGRGAEEFPD